MFKVKGQILEGQKRFIININISCDQYLMLFSALDRVILPFSFNQTNTERLELFNKMKHLSLERMYLFPSLDVNHNCLYLY